MSDLQKVFTMPQTGGAKLEHLRISKLGAQDVRFIGKDHTGWFTIDGEEHQKMTEIEMQVVAVIPIVCDDFYLFNSDMEKYDRWFEVVFIDKNAKFSTMFLKTESSGNFETVIRKMDLDGKPYPTQVIKAKAVKREKDNRGYFALEFEHIGDADGNRIEELAKLMEENQELLLAQSRFYSGKAKKIARNAA